MAREAWTDERLDDLNARIGRLEQRMDAGFAEMRGEFQAVRGEIAALNRNLMHLTWGLIGAMLVGFLGTIVAVLTQM